MFLFLFLLVFLVSVRAQDLSYDVVVEVKAPSSVRITVETPYVTSAAECPTAYLFDFEDPVETLPPVDGEYSRRANTQSTWEPITYYAHEDKLGKPRSPCGNYDFKYDTPEIFSALFQFPDSNSSYFPYSRPPLADQNVWNATLGIPGVPNATQSWWRVGEPVDGRVNYTMGFWDLVAGYHECQDYATGDRLVEKGTEPEPAYFMGIPYYIETYSWKLFLCAVAYQGASCRDAQATQTYAKTCTTVPFSFTVAPQQLGSATTTTLNTSLVTKTFLHSVDAISSDCPLGHERVAVTFQNIFFDTALVIIQDDVHKLYPEIFFENVPHVNMNMSDASDFDRVKTFLQSSPSKEGFYKLKRHVLRTTNSVNVHQQMVVLTKCFHTGYDARLNQRSDASVFAEAVSLNGNVANVHAEVMLRREGIDIDTKTILYADVISTKESFTLSSTRKLENREASTLHHLYGSYENARDSTGIHNSGLQDGTVVMENEQLCSKHQAHAEHAASVSLKPMSVGFCILTSTGNTRKDGHGTPVAGRTVWYATNSMSAPSRYTFGCERNWINLSGVVPSADGVYYLSHLERLPDDNHETVFWLVSQGVVNDARFGATGPTVADVFGVGLFYYDADTNVHLANVSKEMQIDSVTVGLATEDLTAGCFDFTGALRASCNLVCFSMREGMIITEEGAAEKNVMIDHKSVAKVANQTQSELDDRHVARRLLEAEQTTENEIKIITFRRDPKHHEAVIHEQDKQDRSSRDMILSFWVIFTSLIFVGVGVCMVSYF